MQSQATTTQTITQTTMPNPRNTSKTTKSSDPVSNTPLQSDHEYNTPRMFKELKELA